MESTHHAPAQCQLAKELRPLRMAGFDEDEADCFTGVLPMREGENAYRLLMFKNGRLIDTSRPLDKNGDMLTGEALDSHVSAIATLMEPR